MLVEYGLRTLTRESTFFITVTLKAGPGLEKDADYVRATWRKFLVLLNSQYPGTEWIKVVELTKQSQPHIHAVMTFLRPSLVPMCQIRAKYDRAWRGLDCECLEHVFSGWWHSITGNSYVVDVRPVSSAKGAASYIAKYITKSITYTRRLRELGFKRSWARSRGWPGDKLQLAETKERGWLSQEFTGPDSSAFPEDGSAKWWLKRSEWSHLQKRTGTDLAKELGYEREIQGVRSDMKHALKVLRWSA